MQLSVIILNYNVRYFLELCVTSVKQAIQDLDAEIIVIDNASSDNSCAMMRERFPEITLIENKENVGFPKGNNIAVASAKGDYLCILNPDTVVAEDTFTKLFDFVKHKSQVGIVGVRLFDGAGNFLPESKRGVPTPFVAFTKITGLYKISDLFGKYYASHVEEGESGEVDILVGAFMFMKRELYNTVGGFDENCFMYSDDIDLSYRVLKLGKKNYYCADTTVVHYKGESTIKDFTYVNRFREAMNYFYKKHFKVSAAFDIFMRIGAYFFALLKSFPKPKRQLAISHYFVFTKSSEQKEWQRFLGLNTRTIGRIAENFITSLNPGEKMEMIFDNRDLTFKDIIMRMQKYNDKNVTFKIIPKNTKYMIGSNDSNDRGEVITIPEQVFSPK